VSYLFAGAWWLCQNQKRTAINEALIMTIPVQTQLPDNLIAQAQELIKAGWADDLDALLTDALSRYLESHSVALSEKFIEEDVQWGLHGVSLA
jgi:hypothetical protein